MGSSAELGDSMAAGRPEERKLRRAGRGLLRKLHVAGGQSQGARGPGPPQPGPSPHVPELCLLQHNRPTYLLFRKVPPSSSSWEEGLDQH